MQHIQYGAQIQLYQNLMKSSYNTYTFDII